jgi:hypothetical protein
MGQKGASWQPLGLRHESTSETFGRVSLGTRVNTAVRKLGKRVSRLGRKAHILASTSSDQGVRAGTSQFAPKPS